MTRPRGEVARQTQQVYQALDPTDEKVPVSSDTPPPAPRTPKELQRHVLRGGSGEDKLNVMLLIDGSDADGVRTYNEALPVSVIRALLDPDIKDFFIPIAGTDRMKPPRAKGHYLHSGYIREIILLDALPEEEV